MLGRLWYPQLDVYDTIRRMGLLLSEWGDYSPSFERLFIADFFFANPPLLHKTNMKSETREIFMSLKIPKQEKVFLQYPLAPILYHKMESVQKQSLQSLTGKGMLDLESLKTGSVKLNEFGRELTAEHGVLNLAENEKKVVKFLTESFAFDKNDGLRDLRQRTGLRRAV